MVCRGCGRDLGDTDYCPACDGEKIFEGNSIVINSNLFSAYGNMFKNSTQFGGRCRRCEYWLALAMNIIVLAMAYLGYLWLPAISFGNFFDLVAIWTALFCDLFLMVYVYVMIIPIISMTVRRFHDIGKSCWWVIGIFTAFIFGLDAEFMLLKVLLFAGGIGVWLTFSLKDSCPGINKYGPNRKGVE